MEKTKRKRGRPKKTEPVMTPEVIETIRRMYVRGCGARKIAEAIGTSPTAVQYQIEHTVKPLLRESAQFDTGLQLSRAEEIILLAFEGYERSLQPAAKKREKFTVAAAIKQKIKQKSPAGLKLTESQLDTIQRDGDRGWLEIVLSAMDFMAKIKGAYAPKRVFHEDTGLRVAGLDRSQFKTQIASQMVELLLARREHQAVIDAARRASEGRN